MNSFIIFVVGLVIGAIVVFLVFRNFRNDKTNEKNTLDLLNQNKAKIVEENEKKILDLIAQKGEVSNDDVQKLLSISDAGATKYMQRLESKGKVVQVGSEGHAVRYKLK
ncbi:MAG: hypothetical protein A3A98_00975 [Candidatus Staskawiczbacteria bacterium RIFCSPLOWO2_01_FULL_40_39]|uniref:Uncharacterized protein n=1 Tax=Candidatus Staskawiczbacteria bacterium RIFCSPHIGHO2_01_FULL_39_25 TaxID=1802202 RepID=A0A1G2HN38_9BACT|nr:MAG: hypothetical protein A2730_00975 [Candidatus Staskawiczbacteria bacterium RIFCSPHIGHO2_01_FULL_39_25]OGZ73303.1 MAG: hypothetical protein A3A98_00975 [Candidatus Staskawiczbacteria bacterium RIFCSPLOWO2_01_FULL_40_39]